MLSRQEEKHASKLEEKQSIEEQDTLPIPADYVDPITQELLVDPVVAADGQSYERASITEWIRGGHQTSPMTNEPLRHTNLTPNIRLKSIIEEFKAKLPAIQKEDQIKKDLQAAIKLREEFIAGLTQKLPKLEAEIHKQTIERTAEQKEHFVEMHEKETELMAARREIERLQKQSLERQATLEQELKQAYAQVHAARQIGQKEHKGQAAALLPLPLATVLGQIEATEQQLLELQKHQSANRLKRGLLHRVMKRILNSSRLQEGKEQQTHALVQAQQTLNTAQGRLEAALKEHDAKHKAELETSQRHYEEEIQESTKKKNWSRLGVLGQEAEKREKELTEAAAQRRSKIEADSRGSHAKIEGEALQLQQQLQSLKVAKADKQRQIVRRAERVAQLSARLKEQAATQDALLEQQQKQSAVLGAFFTSQQRPNKYKQPIEHYKGKRTREREEILRREEQRRLEEERKKKQEEERRAALKPLQKELIAACKINDIEKVQALINQGADTNYFDPDVPAGSPEYHPLRAALYCFGKDTVDLIISRADEGTLKLCAEIGQQGRFAHVLEFILNGCTYGEFYQRYNAQGGGDLFDAAGHVKCNEFDGRGFSLVNLRWMAGKVEAIWRQVHAMCGTKRGCGRGDRSDRMICWLDRELQESTNCDIAMVVNYLREAAETRAKALPNKRHRI